jgi:hypothetical protein
MLVAMKIMKQVAILLQDVASLQFEEGPLMFYLEVAFQALWKFVLLVKKKEHA